MNRPLGVAAITGAGSGIGLAIARRLAADGWRLGLGAWPDLAPLDEFGEAVHAELLDVRDRERAAAFVDAVEQRFGQLDVLVTCAGVHTSGPSAELAWEDWDELIDVNLSGTFALVRAALPGMLGRGAGRIVTVSSELGLTGMAENAAYCASKGGVIGLTKALARECAPRGVLVNCIAPGPVLTPMLTGSDEYADGGTPGGMPIGRYGEPDEIAAVVHSLVGEAGTFFVGQVISPNGGAVI